MTPDPAAAEKKPKQIVMMLHDLRGGGAERGRLRLLKAFCEMGHSVELVLIANEGAYLKDIPKDVSTRVIGKSNVFKAVPDIMRYLRENRPASVLTSLTHMNVAVLIAKILSRSKSKIIVVEHNQISEKAKSARHWRAKMTYIFAPILYRFAYKVVGVSEGVAEDIRKFTGLGKNKVICIYNPSFDRSILDLATQDTDHPWVNDGSVPIIVAVGRLHRQKGFDMLIPAFAKVRTVVGARLMILGEGVERELLERQAGELGIADHVCFTGFVSNPYAIMSRADLFVLSSRWEGLPTVLIEALACGVKVVATDCPSGPKEILENGKLGPLVEVEQVDALADAILETLEAPLIDHSQRAFDYDVGLSAKNYLSVCA